MAARRTVSHAVLVRSPHPLPVAAIWLVGGLIAVGLWGFAFFQEVVDIGGVSYGFAAVACLSMFLSLSLRGAELLKVLFVACLLLAVLGTLFLFPYWD
jgi:hypothetical protein